MLSDVICKHIKVTGLEPGVGIKFQYSIVCGLCRFVCHVPYVIRSTSFPWRAQRMTVYGFLYLRYWLKCQRITKFHM